MVWSLSHPPAHLPALRSPHRLLCRALVQALSAPLGGVAGHCLHRGRVVGAGCLLWAAMTATFAACTSLRAGVAVWAVNGLGLALVLPNTQARSMLPGRAGM